MKKVLAIILALVMVLSLAACGGKKEDEGKSSVQQAIEAAQKMSVEELEAAAKKELEENPDLTFNADSLTSGVNKALQGFEKKYEWMQGRWTYNVKKGAEYQTKLTAAQKAGSYIADFVMIQDGSFLKNAMIDTGFLLSYVPSGEGIEIAEEDQQPLVGVTFNKVFMYDNTNVGTEQLKNVWQMTGVDGVSLKGVSNVSYQSPLAEDVNQNFLIMLTGPDACEKLTAAYKSYFGKDYDPSGDDYENIGYKFVAEFIANVGHWHSSDTSEVKAINNYANEGRIIFAGLCKLKDYPYYKSEHKDSDLYYKRAITAAGWNTEVEGFDGFVYNMWTLIPDTAKLPYTACLFIRYIHTEEGFNAGWGGILGYYSSNRLIPTVEGDPALSEWKEKCIVEDTTYLDSAYNTAAKFIMRQMSGVN